MEYGWSEELEEFRAQVQAFARDFKTPELEAEIANADQEATTRGPLARKIRDEIERRGWMRMCWPPELGGEGKSPWFQFILTNELQSAGVPYSLGVAAMIGPAIERFGTEEQKQRYLPGLWSGEITCALGYSEPNAGTDLASLETIATRDGDEWVINGQKLWSSPRVASHIWLAARTDPNAPKHRGISMFIVPVASPGISIRPVYIMTGGRVDETFFENVRVSAHALIGEEGRGWYVAANALDHERVSIGGGPALQIEFNEFVQYAKEQRPDLLGSDTNRHRLAELNMDLHVLRALAVTNGAIIARGNTPTMEASMAKVWSSELRYRMYSMFMDLGGRAFEQSKGSEGAPLGGEVDRTYRSSPILRFGGGTNEVQRNIIAERGLGLPR